MYVYLKSEPGLWTVGFYDPVGFWHSESDHCSTADAAQRVAWLNGSGRASTRPDPMSQALNEGDGAYRP